MKNENPYIPGKVIVILGPTASGKSDLAVLLAKKFNGEVVSADSRQVYKGLDIGTGKITKTEMSGIKHHLLDVANAKSGFSVVKYKQLAKKAINDILTREKVPIIAGGTGQYISALIDNISFPEVPPNKELRAKLEKKTTTELFVVLEKLDPRRAEEIDQHNPHRLVRAIEIVHALGSVPILENKPKGQPARLTFGKIKEVQLPSFETLQIGIKIDNEKLKEKIYERIILRLKKGMLLEVEDLHKKGLSWKRMEALGLEYRFISRHLHGKITKDEMVEELNIATRQYAKRQRTWWKRDNRIKWFTLSETKKIEEEITKFLI